MPDLKRIKDFVFSLDNTHCFIEREMILNRVEKELKDYSAPDKYARAFAALLGEISTPVRDFDYFAGGMVEGPLPEGQSWANGFLNSVGHMSFDYEKILKVGLSGILEEIKTNSEAKGDADSLDFARNAEIVITAVRDFANRYSLEAEKQGREEMAKALMAVPFEPAYDFYSALQSVWLVHMIASCLVGDRDYAFGRFDKYMLTYYKKARESGKTKEELIELLAGFMIKTNEICGTNTHNYKAKPVWCQASKQYINIGGEEPNEFSFVVLDAAMLVNMAQPQIVVLLDPSADREFTKKTFEALALLTDKMNIYNYPQTKAALLEMGLPEEVASDYSYSACCTFDLNYHSFRLEKFATMPQTFLETIKAKDYDSLEDLMADFETNILADIQDYADETQKGFDAEKSRKMFVFDSVLLSDSAKECHYASDGTAPYNVMNIFCPGVATIGDSLMVMDRLVFKEKRFAYREFIDILDRNFEGYEALRQEILSYTKFGNDTDADDYTRLAGETFIKAVKALKLKDNFYAMPGFYSLERDNTWKTQIGATPDGRLAGEPFSENQSPTYGADKSGITALLNSIAKLPLDKTVTGGLNITFSQKMSPEILQALVVSYFEMGGFHVGITVVDKAVLRDAMKNPEKYRTLTVRLYGFSEYFINLPDWQQIALLNRTEY